MGEQLDGDRLVFHDCSNDGVWRCEDQVAERHLAQQASLCINDIDRVRNISVGLEAPE